VYSRYITIELCVMRWILKFPYIIQLTNAFVHLELSGYKGKGIPISSIVSKESINKLKAGNQTERALYRTKNSKTSHMCVLTTHVVCYHDNLQDVCIYWLAVTRNSVSFEHTSNVK
jgi:hypothetical protein